MTRLGQAIAVLEERVRQRESLLAEYREQAGAEPAAAAAPPRRSRPARVALSVGKARRRSQRL